MSYCSSPALPWIPSKNRGLQPNLSIPKRSSSAPISSLRIGPEEIAEVIHNKVLLAATIASAIGQFSKPLTSAINGKGVDLKAAVRSGGMPSTHSAAVAAAATSLGLERGLSDSIFGMSVIFAAIVMYDAQGVRREVGNHARVLNMILKARGKSTPCQQEESSNGSTSGTSSINSEKFASLLSLVKNSSSLTSDPQPFSALRSGITSSKMDPIPSLKVDGEEPAEKAYIDHGFLSESVGHTEIQVIVGALLGFVVSLAIDAIL